MRKQRVIGRSIWNEIPLNEPGSFTCHCGNTGVERTPNKSQHTKLTLEKKTLPPLLPGFELATFRSRVRSTCQQVTLLPAIKQPLPHLVKSGVVTRTASDSSSPQSAPTPYCFHMPPGSVAVAAISHALHHPGARCGRGEGGGALHSRAFLLSGPLLGQSVSAL